MNTTMMSTVMSKFIRTLDLDLEILCLIEHILHNKCIDDFEKYQKPKVFSKERLSKLTKAKILEAYIYFVFLEGQRNEIPTLLV